MTATGVEPRPSDWLLAWLSARGRASRPTVERACRAISGRFDSQSRGDRSPTYRYVEPLRRIGHIEEAPGGLAVVPSTLCWSCRADRGVFVGSRDGSLLDELRRRFGARFVVSHPAPPWPATWGVSGGREAVAAALDGLGVDVVDEPGMRLLESLPTLEDAIAAWPDSGRPPALSCWEVAGGHGRGGWSPTDDLWVGEGLIRMTGRGRRGWFLLRNGAGRPLATPERRAVAWWAEMARRGRPRLVYQRGAGRLVLPESLLPPPVLVERPLIWVSGVPPGRGSGKRRSYEAIDPDRAAEVARVLGIQREDAP